MPDGYAPSAWSCVGATSFTDTTVTVALGQTVTCTITNDDIAASLSLDKVVTNDNGGTAVADGLDPDRHARTGSSVRTR